jgi:CheY-like chemotaxis protein
MKILIADDDAMARHVLRSSLSRWGFDVLAATSGEEALHLLRTDPGIGIAVLDWVMPGMEGPDVCQVFRRECPGAVTHLILLTTRDLKTDLVTGLRSGANDYVTKPFDPDELRARVEVGRTVVELRLALASRVRELEEALAQVKQLRGLLPICMYCKKVRNSQDYWEQVEAYISRRTDAQFSHRICPQCWVKEVAPELQQPGGCPGAATDTAEDER